MTRETAWFVIGLAMLVAVWSVNARIGGFLALTIALVILLNAARRNTI